VNKEISLVVEHKFLVMLEENVEHVL